MAAEPKGHRAGRVDHGLGSSASSGELRTHGYLDLASVPLVVALPALTGARSTGRAEAFLAAQVGLV